MPSDRELALSLALAEAAVALRATTDVIGTLVGVHRPDDVQRARESLAAARRVLARLALAEVTGALRGLLAEACPEAGGDHTPACLAARRALARLDGGGCETCRPPNGDGKGTVMAHGPDGEPSGEPCPDCHRAAAGEEDPDAR